MTLRDARVSLRRPVSFQPVFGIITIVVVALEMIAGGRVQLVPYPVRASNVLRALGFQGVVSGTAEEPLFRAFVMLVLLRSWPETVPIGHWYPFAIWQFSPLQVVTAFVLGIPYAAIFARTHSLLASICAHNAANVLVVVTSVLMHALLPANTT